MPNVSRKRARRSSSVGARGGGRRRIARSLGAYRTQPIHRFQRWGPEFVIGDDTTLGIGELTAALGWTCGTSTSDIGYGAQQVGISGEFSLQQVADYTEFTNLYDSFRIDKVEIHVNSLFNVNSALQGGQVGTIIHTADYDDAAVPASQAVIQEYGASKMRRLDKSLIISLRPKVARQVFQGLTVGYETPSGPTWVDCNTPSVIHYGFKAWLNNLHATSAAGPASLVKFQVKYYLSMKMAR